MRAIAQRVLRAGAIQVYTSRWQNKELAELRCQPVGVSRGTPRFGTGFRYRLMRELAPDGRTWSQDDEEAFRTSYVRQLEELGAEEIIGRLAQISGEVGGLPLVLLCYEKLGGSDPGNWCHRRMLSDWLEERTGLVLPELRAGDLPQREDAPELRLFHYRAESNGE